MSWTCCLLNHVGAEPCPLENFNHCNFYYKPKMWLDVVTQERILAPEVVVPCSKWPTIPHSWARRKAHLFPDGEADTSNKPGSGDPLLVRYTMLRRMGQQSPKLPWQTRAARKKRQRALAHVSDSSFDEGAAPEGRPANEQE